MAGDEEGDPLFTVQLQDQFPDLDDPLGIQTVDWFVEHKKVGVPCQCDGDPETLAHAEGEVFRLFPSRVLETDQLQKLRNPVK